MKRTTIGLTALVTLIGGGVQPVMAATISVAAGEVAENPGNGKCSLIEAIKNSEADGDTSGGDCTAGSGVDTVTLAAGSTYVLTAPYTQVELGTNDTNTGLPGIRNELVIEGQGATIERDTALWSGTPCGGMSNSAQAFRILYIPTEGTLTAKDVTLRYGCSYSSNAGGAIFNNGTLTLDGVVVTENESYSSAGGIHNNGALTLHNTTLELNQAKFASGGGIVNRGQIKISNSTIGSNTATGAGGAIDNYSGATNGVIDNSTISTNSSAGLGGAMWNGSGVFDITNTTVALNIGTSFAAAPGPGSGIYSAYSGITLKNSLLANQANGENCSGSFAGNNNLSDDATCPATTDTPLMGPLADNGGATKTHALLAGSPGIDAGDNAAASLLATDQRGTGYARVVNATVDIGAYEYGDADPIAPSVEDAVPDHTGSGNGDGNGDGILDSQQASVVSMDAAAGGAMATIATSDETITLTNLQASTVPADAPAGVAFPNGVFGFTLNDVTPGATETVTVYVPTNAAITGYWKKDTSGQWQDIASSVTQEGNKTKIVFELTEGGSFDFDADSTTITDPGGPAFVVSTAGITVAPTSGLTTTEAGGTDTFTIVLDSAPTADVSIALSSSDSSEASVSPASLTFTAANWDTPQTVTVTGVDDAVDDDNVAFTIITDPASSADPSFDRVDPADVSATNGDDEDTDGVNASEEGQVPGVGGSAQGDGNGDGQPDSVQDDVASFQSGGSYITVASQGGEAVSTVGTATGSEQNLPSGLALPYGQISFTVAAGSGGATTVDVFVPYDPSIVEYYKRERVSGAWRAMGATVQHVPASNPTKTRLTFTLNDGDALDMDGSVNGSIQDPGGPVASTTAVPTLGLWGLGVLAALLGGVGVARRRQAGRAT